VASVALSKTLLEAGTVSKKPLAEPYQARKLPEIPSQGSVPVVHGSIRVLPHYKLNVAPNNSSIKYDNTSTYVEQYGLFATESIEAGTRLIWEPPMITLPDPGDQAVELMEAFDELKPYQQEEFWSLNPAPLTASPLLTFMAERITEKLAPLKAIADMPEEGRTKEEQEALTEGFPKVAKAAKMFRIAARWHYGRYSLIDLPEHEREQLPYPTPVAGLFIETARLRHSCIPNCYAYYNASTNFMIVQATTNIPAGAELTLPTIRGIYYHAASTRSAELKTKFGFTCTCPACDPSHHNFAMHESARLQIHTRTMNLQHFLTLLDIITYESVTSDLRLRDQDLPDPSDLPTLEDLRDAEFSILALIKNFKSTGCEGPELIRWYNALIDRIQPRVAHLLDNDDERVRWWRIILRHAIECVKIAHRCFGADSDEVARMKHRVDGVERKIQDAETRRELVRAGKKKLGEMVKRKDMEKKKKKKEEEWEVVGVTGDVGEKKKEVDIAW
jgi:hypothetical protein